MATLSLVRIDTHLVHSQIRNVWLKLRPSKLILIIDDEIAADPIVSQVYEMAAPPGLKLRVLGIDAAAAAWQKDQFGPLGPVFVLMRDIKTALSAYQRGFDFPEVQLGWIGGTAGGGLYGPLVLTDDNKSLLTELEGMGCRVTYPDVAVEYMV
jgi:D-glucosaminate-specific PTS system IIB component